jgi:hypothetical protein
MRRTEMTLTHVLINWLQKRYLQKLEQYVATAPSGKQAGNAIFVGTTLGIQTFL